MLVNPFNPRPASGQTASSGAASATLTFTGGAANDPCFRVVNKDATNGVHVRICSEVPVDATTADTFVRPNSEIILRKNQGANLLTYIQSVGAVSFFVQTGTDGT